MKRIINAFQNWNDYSGRVSYSEFWKFYLSILAITFLANSVYSLLNLTAISNVTFLISIPIILPMVVKRFHDRNYSGWWALLFLPFNLLASISQWTDTSTDVYKITVFVCFLVTIVGLWIVGRKGNKEPNKFGPAPLV